MIVSAWMRVDFLLVIVFCRIDVHFVVLPVHQLRSVGYTLNLFLSCTQVFKGHLMKVATEKKNQMRYFSQGVLSLAFIYMANCRFVLHYFKLFFNEADVVSDACY
jgi:hypothetical protein